MKENIKKMAQDALNCIDKFEYGKTETPAAGERNDPLRIAAGLSRYFASIPVKEYAGENLFGRFRLHCCLYPGDLYVRNGHVHYNEYWDKLCSRRPRPLFYWGWTHIVLDFSYILQNGLDGYIAEIDALPKKNRLQRAMKVTLLALEEMFARFARSCKNEVLAAILKKVPAKPAETFYEAVQSVWSVFQLVPDSLGRIDQYLYPYYRRGLAEGSLTRERAAELLEELFVKVYESQMNNTALPISGHNHLVVGGYLEDGTDGFNELSMLILECIAELPTFRPQASFRYTRFTSKETMERVTDLNARCQWIVFVNDEPRIPGMTDIGIERQDAINYTVVGCNEWCLPCGAKMDLAHVNLLHSLEKVLYEDERFLQCKSYADVFALWKESLREDMAAIASEYEKYAAAVAKDINVLDSALCLPCIRSGRSFTNRGTKYYGLTLSFNSISNLADSLSVLRRFVFEQEFLSLRKMREMLQSNYRGFEAERSHILAFGSFFGNDDDYADGIAEKIVDAIYEVAESFKNSCFNVLAVGSFVGATHPNIVLGHLTRATPDGRKDGEAFTMGIAQSGGKDKKGLTALLNSISKLNYRKFCGCIVSNIKLDKNMASTDEKRKKLAALYYTFLQRGGMQLQINYLSQQELLEAQKNPEEYKNLIVRVTGYSGYFTRFDRDLQDDIIRRTVIQN